MSSFASLVSALAAPDDRAIGFSAAPEAAAESFDPTCQAVLLALAGLAVILSAVLLLVGSATQRRTDEVLDRIERSLEDADG
jgi:hypothetical protein